MAPLQRVLLLEITASAGAAPADQETDGARQLSRVPAESGQAAALVSRAETGARVWPRIGQGGLRVDARGGKEDYW